MTRAEFYRQLPYVTELLSGVLSKGFYFLEQVG